MRSNVFLSVLLSALIAFSTVSFAQEGSVPGLQVRNLLVTEIDEGAAVEQAAEPLAREWSVYCHPSRKENHGFCTSFY